MEALPQSNRKYDTGRKARSASLAASCCTVHAIEVVALLVTCNRVCSMLMFATCQTANVRSTSSSNQPCPCHGQRLGDANFFSLLTVLIAISDRVA
eukprot:437860-Pleurochrysis_carterae.AAC.1